jgi:hypothetical protein
MNKYTVYFEVFGKMLQTEVMAESAKDAMRIVKGSVSILEVREQEKPQTMPELDHMDYIMKQFFGVK